MSATYDNPQLETQFKSALATLGNIPSINRGGCGIAALAIHRWLLAHGVKPVVTSPFRLLWDGDDEWEAQRNDDRLWKGEIYAANVPAHIVIELHDGLYDADGIYDPISNGDIEQDYHLTDSELLYIVNRGDANWNSRFKRAKYVPVIEQALGISLADVIVD
jgi:hypothetical protein